MKGFSPRNLQYMRTFDGAFPDPESAQQLLRNVRWGGRTWQIPPRHRYVWRTGHRTSLVERGGDAGVSLYTTDGPIELWMKGAS